MAAVPYDFICSLLIAPAVPFLPSTGDYPVHPATLSRGGKPFPPLAHQAAFVRMHKIHVSASSLSPSLSLSFWFECNAHNRWKKEWERLPVCLREGKWKNIFPFHPCDGTVIANAQTSTRNFPPSPPEGQFLLGDHAILLPPFHPPLALRFPVMRKRSVIKIVPVIAKMREALIVATVFTLLTIVTHNCPFGKIYSYQYVVFNQLSNNDHLKFGSECRSNSVTVLKKMVRQFRMLSFADVAPPLNPFSHTAIARASLTNL